MQLNTANNLHPVEHPATQNSSEQRTEKMELTTLEAPSKVIQALIDFLLLLVAILKTKIHTNFEGLPTLSGTIKS